MLAKLSGVEFERTSSKFRKKEKENPFFVLFTQCIKRAREVRKFHVSVLQGRLRNAQKKRDARAKVLVQFTTFSRFLSWSAGSFLEQRLAMEPNRSADISKLGCAAVLNPLLTV